MQIQYIPVTSKIKVQLPLTLIKKLPNNLILFTTIQYFHNLPKIQEQLKKHNKTLILIKPKHAAYKGQILGCSIEKINKPADAFLYIGDGLFHPQALTLKNNIPVYTYNPISKKQNIISEKDIKRIQQKTKGALLKFHTSKNIGILVTTKPGQNRLKLAKKLEKKYPKKKFYIFLSNTLNPHDLENFPYIDIFINTMCPRIAYDDLDKFTKSILNIEELGFTW